MYRWCKHFFLQETTTATNTEDNADCLPWSPPLTEEESTTPSVSSHPSNTQSNTHTHSNDWYVDPVGPWFVSVIMLMWGCLVLKAVCSTSVCVFTDHTVEPCWYCLRSLDSEYRPETPCQVLTFLTRSIILKTVLVHRKTPSLNIWLYQQLIFFLIPQIEKKWIHNIFNFCGQEMIILSQSNVAIFWTEGPIWHPAAWFYGKVMEITPSFPVTTR